MNYFFLINLNIQNFRLNDFELNQIDMNQDLYLFCIYALVLAFIFHINFVKIDLIF